MKQNCWEFHHCGRELGGINSKSQGVCNAVTFTAFNGTNNGFNGGRYCWAICGTDMATPMTCTHHPPDNDCTKCGFYQLVKEEEKINFIF